MAETILVIEDEIEIVRLLRDYLEEAGFRVLAAYNAERGLHLLRAESPALAILDLGLPDRDGRDLTRLVRTDPALAALPIIMLTARVAESERIVGLELGADDYIVKPFNPREVVARVRAVLRRSAGAGPGVARRLSIGDLTLDPEGHALTVRGDPVELTPTEFALLELLMENPGHTYTREELLEKTLGYAYEGTGRTLDTHILNLRRKIEPDPRRPEYIQTVHRIGYRMAKSGGKAP